jgi:hypothetical protein
LPDSDVVVHVDAIEDKMTETIKDKIRLYASDFPQIKNIHSIFLSRVIDNNKSTILIESTDSLEKGKEDNSYDDRNKAFPKFLHIYLDVQMDNTLSLGDAHKIIDVFEQKIKNEIPSKIRLPLIQKQKLMLIPL